MMKSQSQKEDLTSVDKGSRVPLKYRFNSPNRPVAFARYIFNIYRETFLHPTVTSTIDMRTGRVVARDGEELSGGSNGRVS